MKKDEVLRIRMSTEDKKRLKEASLIEDVVVAELAREAINNKVKRIIGKGK